MKKSSKLDQLELMRFPFGHGGKRNGAGNKPKKGKTVVLRVPVDCLSIIQEVIKLHRAGVEVIHLTSNLPNHP